MSMNNGTHIPQPRPSNQQKQQERSSKRKRKSTLVYVDGHAVLRQNNYVVTGDSYNFQGETPHVKPKKKKPRTQETRGVVSQAAPRQAAPHEVERRQHNERVQAMARKNQGFRHMFWARHCNLLKHFCEPKVLAELRQQQSNHLEVSYQPLEFVSTPKAIQALLRDYQQQGLTFMANMHNQNLSMILGDEMGLVSNDSFSVGQFLVQQKTYTNPTP